MIGGTFIQEFTSYCRVTVPSFLDFRFHNFNTEFKIQISGRVIVEPLSISVIQNTDVLVPHHQSEEIIFKSRHSRVLFHCVPRCTDAFESAGAN